MLRVGLILMMSVVLAGCSAEQPVESGSLAPVSPPQIIQEAEPGHTHGPDDPLANVPRITVEDLRTGMDEGWAIVVDVRSPQQYEASHIAGAVSVPVGQLGARIGELPEGRMIVTYCT